MSEVSLQGAGTFVLGAMGTPGGSAKKWTVAITVVCPTVMWNFRFVGHAPCKNKLG
jgi:hypothetical protein